MSNLQFFLAFFAAGFMLVGGLGVGYCYGKGWL